LARGQNVQHSPDTFADEEVAVLGPSQFVRTHRAALHEEVWLWNVIKVWKTALGAFSRERVDGVIEHVAAIHAVVRDGDLNASHGRNLDG
jgi:hypothetical protein